VKELCVWKIVLAEMARQALKVDSQHHLWRKILDVFGRYSSPREPIIHWTRLAEPVPGPNGCNAASWKLVA